MKSSYHHPDFTGSWFDWVSAKFDEITNENRDTTNGVFPAKILTFYTVDTDPEVRTIVLCVNYKLDNAKESKFGDTKIATHYRIEFLKGDKGNAGKPALRSIPINSIKNCIFAIEANTYSTPIPPITKNKTEHREHTVMAFLPRKEWAAIFIEWTKEIFERVKSSKNDENKR